MLGDKIFETETEMASCLEDTEEKSNGTKLIRLLIDGGTEALQRTFDGIHPPATLTAVLHSHLFTLTHLRHKRVLNSSQWDKLFPPSGAAPDSKQFDITLLYILLRNICGLTPPATGWESLPLVTDTTLKANLARIKYYRNTVYGHISSTGVENVLFEHYWREISGALVALGVDQVDIDVLKSSPLGAIDYNKMMDEWSVNDKEVREVANETKKEAQAARKTAEETKLAVGKAKTVLEAMGETLTSKMDDLTSEMRQISQLVPSVAAGFSEQQGALGEHLQSVAVGQAMILEEQGAIGEQLQSVAAGFSEQQGALGEHLQSVKAEQVDLGKRVGYLEQQSKSKHLGKEVADMKKSDFRGKINVLSKAHHVGTRSWILDDIQQLLSSIESRGMVISARAGFGKSVIAAVTCQTMQQQGRLAACHFIEHNKPNLNTPKDIIGSLARHLCDTVPEFEKKLAEQLSGSKITNMNCSELFDVLLEQPLIAVNNVQGLPESKLVVLDGLDEIDLKKKDEFVKALIAVIPKLPGWIKFVLTIRTQKSLVFGSDYLTDVTIEPENPNNEEDIKQYLTYGLQKVYPLENVERAVNSLVELSGGSFLYVHSVVDFSTKHKELQMSQLPKHFPNGISSVYEVYMKRLFEDYQVLVKGLDVEGKKFFDFLAVVVSSVGLLPESFVKRILGINGETRDLKIAARETLKRLTHLFPSEEKHFTVLHKSLAEWLTETEENEHDFSVQTKDGHNILAALCLEYLQSVKNHLTFPPPVNDCEKYALTFGFHHMLETGGYEKELKECVFDLKLLSSKYSLARDRWYGLKKSVLNEVTRIRKYFKWKLPELDEFIANMCSLKQKSFDQYPHAVLVAAVHCSSTSKLRQQAVHLLSSPECAGHGWVEFMQPEWDFPERRIDNIYLGTSVLLGCEYLHVEESQHRQCWIGTFNIHTKESTERISPFFRVPFICAITPDDKYLVVLTEDGGRVLDIHTLQPNVLFETDGLYPPFPRCCCFLPDGSKLVIGWSDGSVRVCNFFSIEDGTGARTTFVLQTKKTCYTDVPMVEWSPVLCIVSSNGSVLAGYDSGKFLVWNLNSTTWQSIRDGNGDKDATESNFANWRLDLANPERGTTLDPSKAILLTDEWVAGERTAAVSPDSTKVAVLCQPKGSSDRALCVFSTANNKLIASLPVVFCLSILFLDNTRIIIGEYSELLVRSITSGNIQRLLCPEEWEVHCLARTSPVEFIAMLRAQKGSRKRSKLTRIALRNLKP